MRAILFDAGGTLFRERKSRAAIYADAARTHGLVFDERQVAAAMSATHAALPQRVDGAFRYSRPWFRRFIAEVFARLGAPRVSTVLEDELFERFASAATFELFDDVEPTLAELSRRGLALGVVSNWTPALGDLLAKLGVATRFGTVVASAREEVEKPDPAIFRLALRRLGVAASEALDVLHVGDHPELDVAAARAAGLRALLLDRSGSCAGVGSIASLAELPSLVEGERERGGRGA